MSQIRFNASLEHLRPTVTSGGELSYASLGLISGSVWESRQKLNVGNQGELRTTLAQGFFPAGTDLQRRDQVRLPGTIVGTTVSGGQHFEVLQVTPGKDCDGAQDHVGARLRDLSGA